MKAIDNSAIQDYNGSEGPLTQFVPAVTSAYDVSAKTISIVNSSVYPVTTPSAPVAALAGVTGLIEDGTHSYKVTFVNGYGETVASAASNVVTCATGNKKVTVTLPVSSDAGVTARKIYRTEAGGSTYKLLATISDNTTTSYLDNIADATLGAAAAASTADGLKRLNYQAIDCDGAVVGGSAAGTGIDVQTLNLSKPLKLNVTIVTNDGLEATGMVKMPFTGTHTVAFWKKNRNFGEFTTPSIPNM